jgi:hypothetical protein
MNATIRRIAAVIVFVAVLATAQQAAASCPTIAYKVTAKRWVRVKKTKRVHGRLVVVRRHGKIVYVRKLESYLKTLHREVCPATVPSAPTPPEPVKPAEPLTTTTTLHVRGPEGCGSVEHAACTYWISATAVDQNGVAVGPIRLLLAWANEPGKVWRDEHEGVGGLLFDLRETLGVQVYSKASVFHTECSARVSYHSTEASGGYSELPGCTGGLVATARYEGETGRLASESAPVTLTVGGEG